MSCARLDQSLPFANMRDTPYYRDAVWEQFSKAEYDRRYRALRQKMEDHKLDVLIVPGGPSHWSFGGGMLWLTAIGNGTRFRAMCSSRSKTSRR